MEREKQITEKCQSTFTKKIGNTTFKVAVHFAENTTDTLEDKILHLLTVTDISEAVTAETTQKNAIQKQETVMAKSQRSIEERISEKELIYEQTLEKAKQYQA